MNQKLLDIKQIYIQRNAFDYPLTKEILRKYPNAKRKLVDSHWKIPDLHEDPNNVKSCVKIKRETLVIGVKSKLTIRENCRSTDYIAPSQSNGCALSCVFCYSFRRKGYANPITVFVNTDAQLKCIQQHLSKLGRKTTPNQCDPHFWTYDIGENCDVSVDSMISDNPQHMIELFRNSQFGKASFATKYVNKDMLSYDPQRKTRIRFSLMPQSISRVLDVRTSKISARIAAINDFFAAGYEVHINLSPVVIYQGWTQDYTDLFNEIKSVVSPGAYKQLKAEVIFLTHNKQLHDINMQWHPKAEELLWRPEWQEDKVSQTGGHNVRYKYKAKAKAINYFKDLVSKHLPGVQIRYIF